MKKIRWQRPTGALLALAAMAMAGACAGILGIEDAEVELCERYCSAVMANCTGSHAVYRNASLCREICFYLPEGTEGDQGANTIQCRLGQAELAASTGEPGTHCPAAGPGGEDECGANCESLCDLFGAICVGTEATDAFGGEALCESACETLTTEADGGYDVSIQTGDSVQCRLYHVTAATADPETHCGHVAAESECEDTFGEGEGGGLPIGVGGGLPSGI